ncbi:unnamed protein product [Linum tenue]|uniref:Uncharacterized protein n=1 Tax=Linum tenue TaxID=586396 RepID=A0AAV0QJD6_9ROSI|nr:unnamed protein product [Linum tenue]
MENDGANAAGQAQPQAQPQAVDANAALVRTLNPTMKRSININVLTSAAFASTALSQSSFSRSTRSRAVEPDGGVVGSGVALQAGIMAFRSCAMRFISRSFSGGGKVLGEEEKSVENVYIKGLRPEETA